MGSGGSDLGGEGRRGRYLFKGSVICVRGNLCGWRRVYEVGGSLRLGGSFRWGGAGC